MNDALDAFEKRGREAPGKLFASGPLFAAYAASQGKAAYPRLSRMIRNPRLHSVQSALDNAVAISLGLTSYVDDLRRPWGLLLCREQEPRDALDDVIIAWENGDRNSLGESLGPDANSALTALLRGTTWAAVRARLWHANTRGIAVGYRFEIADPWAQPYGTLDSEVAGQGIDPGRSLPDSAEIDTSFTNASGSDCGRRLVKFVRVQYPGISGRSKYVVENDDLSDLLGVIGTCAARRSQ
jgi:hypothetical protein